MSDAPWRQSPILQADAELMVWAEAAVAARQRAWAPYSGFLVGAALVSASGRVFVGCNVENASFSAGICAERTALVTAVAAGERQFQHIAIATDAAHPAAPCGICRQSLAEFALAAATSDLTITLISTLGPVAQCSLRSLLPMAFTPGAFAVRPTHQMG